MDKSQFKPVMEDAEKKELIIKMARWYVSLFRPRATLTDVAKKFGVSQSAVSRYFRKYLASLNCDLYEKVERKKYTNSQRVQYRA